MIYAIADLHLDYTKEKDMKIFGDNWDSYEEKIFENWTNIIEEDDLVLVPGDISWAMKLDDAKIDLERIDRLKGKKIMLKGNHDYWWQSLNKIENLGLSTISFLQNTAFVYERTRIVGARGWISRDFPEFDDHDEKIFLRELNRLKLSLDYKLDEDYDRTLVMMHYPPFNKDGSVNEFGEIFKEHGIKKVLFGHIHGKALRSIPMGMIDGIDYICVSGDCLDFVPRLIQE